MFTGWEESFSPASKNPAEASSSILVADYHPGAMPRWERSGEFRPSYRIEAAG
jgi:hypothetical protein